MSVGAQAARTFFPQLSSDSFFCLFFWFFGFVPHTKKDKNDYCGLGEPAYSSNLQFSQVNLSETNQLFFIFRAAEFDRVDTVKYLLNNGADIEAKDNENRTAFNLAVKRGRTKTAELLLESGAEMKSRDASRRTCIHLAVMHERLETLRMLLNREQGQLINETDKDLRTPLHYAASLGSLKVKLKFHLH